MKAKRSLAARLLEEKDQTQHRVARQLHDSVGQHASALQINLSILAHFRKTLPPRAAKALEDSIELAQMCARELRSISGELHPPLLDALGLIPALHAITEECSERTGMQIELYLPSQMDRMPPGIELALYRIVEDGLTTLCQSGSSVAILRLTRKSKSLVIELAGEISNRSPDAGIIRERVNSIGGRLIVQSTAHRTIYRITLSSKAAGF